MVEFFNVKENGDGLHKNNKRFMSIRASLKVLADLDKYSIDKITPLLVDKILSIQTDLKEQSTRQYES